MTTLGHLPSQLPLTPASSGAGANTYTDMNGLAALKANPNSPQALHAVAQQVDALFLQMMLKSMRDASAEVGEPDSNELGMYQDMFDKQVALTMSQHQGLGIGAATTATASTAMASSPEDFVSQVLPMIRQAAGSLGVSPKGLLAQAALETGWGQRMPRNADGTPSLNLFGIKAGDSWSGARATATTVEFKGGVAVSQRSAFRAYDSIQDSIRDFASLLQGSPRYRDAVAAGSDAQAYVAAIGSSGYATDPQYANKLNGILNGDTLRTALRNAAVDL
jgi:flagellar protein FlgJ